MARYLAVVTSTLYIESEDDLKEYIEARREQWGDDRPEQIKNLAENGFCQLSDEDGDTMIVIKKVVD